MPRWSRELHDANGKWLGRVCGSSPRRRCSVTECRASAEFQCDYPIGERKGRKRKSTTCDRWLCRRHATRVGEDRDFCPAHTRLATTLKGAGFVPRPSAGEPAVVVGSQPVEQLALDLARKG